MGKLRGSKNQYQWYGRESFSKDWNKWHKRNLDVANQLAQLLGKPISEISDLLYNITLQNYSQILNPISNLVSKCDVPYASIDACKELLTIFDFEGNLRHPSDPESLFRLLQLMQQILRWGSDWESKQAELEKMQREANLALQTACQKRVPKKSRRKIKKSDNTSLSSKSISISTIKSKKSFSTSINSNNDNNNSNNNKLIKKRRSRFSTYKRKLFHVDSRTMSLVSKSTMKSIKSIGKIYALKGKKIQISKLPLPVREFLLMDAKGRRRGLGIKDLEILIKKQRYILRLLLERNMNDNPDELLNALILADLDNPKMEIKNQRTVAAEISNFYSAVVSKTPDNISYIKFQLPFFEHFYKSLPRSQKLYNFQTGILPFYDRVAILIHEPYDRKKPSSWYLKKLI